MLLLYLVMVKRTINFLILQEPHFLLKILTTIIRQSNGWVKRGSKARKACDRISHCQFMVKTGLSRRVISHAIARLLKQSLISVADKFGNLLNSGTERSGRSYLFYTSVCALNNTDLCTFVQKPVQKVIHNKTNYTKLNKTKLREGSGVQNCGRYNCQYGKVKISMLFNSRANM